MFVCLWLARGGKIDKTKQKMFNENVRLQVDVVISFLFSTLLLPSDLTPFPPSGFSDTVILRRVKKKKKKTRD